MRQSFPLRRCCGTKKVRITPDKAACVDQLSSSDRSRGVGVPRGLCGVHELPNSCGGVAARSRPRFSEATKGQCKSNRRSSFDFAQEDGALGTF